LVFSLLCLVRGPISKVITANILVVRKQVIIKEKLKFPSGTATALLISVLHGDKEGVSIAADTPLSHDADETTALPQPPRDEPLPSEEKLFWKDSLRSLLYAFFVSGGFTLVSYFIPIIRDLPLFGFPAAKYWLWTVNPSPAYIGQGIIMGFETTIHMLLGAVIGWGILSPLAKQNGWAPGDVSDWKTGSRGWIVWVSLAIMLADSVFSLGSLAFDNIRDAYVAHHRRRERDYHTNTVDVYDHSEPLLPSRPSIGGRSSGDESGRSASMAVLYSPKIVAHGDGSVNSSSVSGISQLRQRGIHKTEAGEVHNAESVEEPDAPPAHLVSGKLVYIGLFLSALMCIGAIAIVFPHTPLVASVSAFFLALVMSVMGVRALGRPYMAPKIDAILLTSLRANRLESRFRYQQIDTVDLCLDYSSIQQVRRPHQSCCRSHLRSRSNASRRPNARSQDWPHSRCLPQGSILRSTHWRRLWLRHSCHYL
jgi:hypothetical protein